MKKMLIVWMMLVGAVAFAQTKVDEERMQRDIEIAENILSTMIRQQLGKRNFFPMEVQGNYLPGYGVTFRLPSEFLGGMFIYQTESDSWGGFNAPVAIEEPVIAGEPNQAVTIYSEDKARQEARSSSRSRSRTKISRNASDSSRTAYNKKLLEAAKNFIADYGDLLSQLPPNEKIVITNRGEGQNFRMAWAGNFDRQKQNIITVEGTRSEVNQLRQGKITRDQLMSKIQVLNTEISDELQPDLELLTSIFNRLYSRDLSKTFFSDENIYYERLKDYGAIYHMQVYASNQVDGFNEDIYDMPTLRLHDVDQQTRDKKVKELYPEFEKGIREDLLEYGRTLKSLKDNEVLTFEIQMTRCKGCNIPSSLELSIKNSALKEYSSGKISKEAALARITVKKGPDQ